LQIYEKRAKNIKLALLFFTASAVYIRRLRQMYKKLKTKE